MTYYHSEGIFKALWWSWMYTVLSVVLWLTFMLCSQGSTLYLSYQQPSDTLSMPLSNDIVGNKSWVNTGVKVYFGHRDTEWRTDEGCVVQWVSIRHYRSDKYLDIFIFPLVHVVKSVTWNKLCFFSSTIFFPSSIVTVFVLQEDYHFIIFKTHS